ncbi:MAG: CARDB domain-containing protein, partial [Candidatus Paceibacterota bacterium]
RVHNLLMAGLLFAGLGLALPQYVQAATIDITGWAWSQGGWISFSGPGYGVREDTVTGELSGFAWASNPGLGWISFNAADVAGCPPGSAECAPKVNPDTQVISGWARACAAFTDTNACIGTQDPNSGGWDGWIALSGTAKNGEPYGLTQKPGCAWGGFAWGSTNFGAISFSGTALDGSPYGVGGPPNDPTCTPDLTVSNVWQGSSSSLSAVVSNANVSTGAGFSNFFQYSLKSDGSDPKDLSPAVALGALPKGGTGTISLTHGFDPGTYYVRACADKSSRSDDGNIVESDDNNNCSQRWEEVVVTDTNQCTPGGVCESGPNCNGDTNAGRFNSRCECSATPPPDVSCRETVVPDIKIKAVPARVRKGTQSTITWSASNVETCSVTGPGLTGNLTNLPAPIAETSQTTTITSQSTYTISCNGGTESKTVVVNILPIPEEI